MLKLCRGAAITGGTTMKKKYLVALSALAGATIGGAAIQTLHAQAKPPVYSVAINELTNAKAYKTEFLPLAIKSIKKHGGAYIAAGAATHLEGSMPNGRIVILRWESMDALKAWASSPDREAAWKIGRKYAKFNVVAAPGVKKH